MVTQAAAAQCSSSSAAALLQAAGLLLGLQHMAAQLAAISAHMLALRQLAGQAPTTSTTTISSSSTTSSSTSTWSPELLQLAVPALALLQQLSRLLPAASKPPDGSTSTSSTSSCQQLLEAHLQLLRQLAPPSAAVLLPSWCADVSWQVLTGPQVGPPVSCRQRLSLALLLSLQSLLRSCSAEQLEQLHGALLGLLQQQEELDGRAAGVVAQAVLVVLEAVPGGALGCDGTACMGGCDGTACMVVLPAWVAVMVLPAWVADLLHDT
jgi:hypothetical protein